MARALGGARGDTAALYTGPARPQRAGVYPATADLCDSHPDDVRVLGPGLLDLGGRARFAGPATTLRVDGDNALVRRALEEPGAGRVLVVDGGGRLDRALVGGNLAALAATNGWAGIVVHGAVRDRLELARTPIGVRALGTCPRKSEKRGTGARDVPVVCCGTAVAPGDHVYADEDGVIASARALA